MPITIGLIYLSLQQINLTIIKSNAGVLTDNGEHNMFISRNDIWMKQFGYIILTVILPMLRIENMTSNSLTFLINPVAAYFF